MLLENLLTVTGGKLLNDPSISRFNSIELIASKVTRGSLFIAELQEDIDVALDNGAYGILTNEQHINITDKEIAWIYVKDIKKSLTKLLRLWLLKTPRTIFYISTQVLEFLEKIQSSPSILLLNGDDEQKSKQILSSSPKQNIFCDDKLFLKRIGVDIISPKTIDVDYEVVDSRVFETSIIIDGTYFDRLLLIPSMIPFLIDAIKIAKSFNSILSINNINFTKSLEPIFVNSLCEIVEFGESDKVLIFASSDLKCEHLKIFEDIKWIKFKLLLPTKIKFSCDIKVSFVAYNLDSELYNEVFKQIKKSGYTLIYSETKETFFKKLKSFNLNKKPILSQGLF